MSTAFIGYGSTLGFADTQAGSYTTVAQVVDIQGPGIEIPGVKITNQDSVSAAQEKLPGLADAKQIKIKLIYLKTAVTTLYGLYRLQKFWKITYPDASTWIGFGHITMYDPNAPLEDAIVMEITIELSGKPVFTAA